MLDAPSLDDLALDLERRGKHIESALVGLVAALEEKVERLERDAMRFRGVWGGASVSYRRGDVVSRDGSAWHCTTDGTTETPGKSSHWQMMLKSQGASK